MHQRLILELVPLSDPGVACMKVEHFRKAYHQQISSSWKSIFIVVLLVHIFDIE